MCLVSGEDARNVEVDPTHVGPPDLILHEIVALSDVPDEIRRRGEALAASGRPGGGSPGGHITFAARALALVEGTNEPDYDDDGDALVWVFALRAEAPVLGEAIIAEGGFAASSSEMRFSKGAPVRYGKHVDFFSAIRTEPRKGPELTA